MPSIWSGDGLSITSGRAVIPGKARPGETPTSEPKPKTAFGRIFPPNEAWLAKAPAEPILDPDLPIIDTHHHLWQRRGGGARGEPWEAPEFSYLLGEFLADCATGHNIVGSVFLECHSM